MASTGSYTGPDGKAYFEVRWYEGTKHRRAKRGEDARRFRTEKQALKFGEEQEIRHRRGEVRWFDKDVNVALTVEQYARIWFEARYGEGNEYGAHTAGTTRAKGSKRWSEGMIRCHIEGTPLGAKRLTAVTKLDVEAWMGQRSKFGGGSGTLANSTLKMAVMLLRTIFEAAADAKLVDRNPVPGNKFLQWPRDGVAPSAKKYVPLTVEQVFDLADAFPARYRAMPLVQAGLGLRIGEVLALRDADICWGRGCEHPEHRSGFGEGGPHVHIDLQFNDTERWHGEFVGGRSFPKSRHSVRAVPLPDVVADVLREHMAEFPPGIDGSLFVTTSNPRNPNALGKPLSHQYYGQQLFKDAMRKAGLPECSTHDLRHHYATVLLKAGLTHEEVARRLGHADAGLVISTYGHPTADGTEADDVRGAMSKSWANGRKKADRHLKAVR